MENTPGLCSGRKGSKFLKKSPTKATNQKNLVSRLACKLHLGTAKAVLASVRLGYAMCGTKAFVLGMSGCILNIKI